MLLDTDNSDRYDKRLLFTLITPSKESSRTIENINYTNDYSTKRTNFSRSVFHSQRNCSNPCIILEFPTPSLHYHSNHNLQNRRDISRHVSGQLDVSTSNPPSWRVQLFEIRKRVAVKAIGVGRGVRWEEGGEDGAVCPRGIREAGAGSRSSDSLAFTRRNSFTRRDLRRPRLLPNGHQEAHLSAMSREIIAHTVVESNTFD